METDPRYGWQDTFISRYHSLNKDDFTLVACPGAGKTYAALKLARELMEIGIINFIMIACPTIVVKEQWCFAATKLKLHIQKDFLSRDCKVSADYDGIAVTYMSISQQPDLYRAITASRRTLVILDEVHHLRDNAAYGESCKHAFEPASRRLSVSGTPFRRDGSQIPFVNYDEGWLRIDHEYSYQEAVTNHTCRSIFFPAVGGDIRFEIYGQEVNYHFEDRNPIQRDPMAAAAHRAAISADASAISPQAEMILRSINEKISQLRDDGDTKAGALIIAMGMDRESGTRHASHIADHMERMFGSRPPVVVSDDPKARDKIRNFREGSDRFLVSINMISEGVDIPRLRVLGYLTNITSEVYFRQAVGRISRGADDAFFFMPADDILMTYAQSIIQERNRAIEQRQNDIENVLGRNLDLDEVRDGPDRRLKVIGGNAEESGIIHGPHRISQDDYSQMQEQLKSIWKGETVPHEIVARFVINQRYDGSFPVSENGEPVLRSDQKAALRRQQNTMASAFAMAHGRKHSEVNAYLNEQIRVGKLREATMEQLADRLRIANDLYHHDADAVTRYDEWVRVRPPR